MNSIVYSRMALSIVALLIVAAANATSGPPPVCPVVKCTPSEFGARTKVYQCPKAFPSDAPVEALLDCMPSSQHSLNCKVFPTEVPPACGSSGANLVYDWTVRVGMSEYPYPPSYNNTLSVSCMGLERVFVSVTVWNGSYSSTDSFGMTCGDDPR